MKAEVDIATTSLGEHNVADQVIRARQRLLEDNARRRETRMRVSPAMGSESSSHGMARAVAAVVSKLPSTGAVQMDWSTVLRLAHLDEPSENTLRELQDALRQARVLAAFGSRVAIFARDPE